MKFLIGTNNPQKIAALKKALSDIISDDIEVEGISTDSYVPDTPYNEENKQGAYNRADKLKQHYPEHYCIGVESGLAERYGLLFEEAWACICFEDKVYYGYSSGLLLPAYVKRKMQEDGIEHGPAMNKIRKELKQFDDRDTWGTYSGKMVLRSVSLEEALRNTLIQIFTPPDSLYNK